MPTLKQTVEDLDTPQGKAFALSVQTLIVLSLIGYSIGTMSNLSPALKSGLATFEVISVVLFTMEYVLRIFVATSPRRYIFSFFGLMDLLAILPFYIGTGFDLRSLRTFRLLRLFRLFKLVRYSAAVRRFHMALQIAKEELILFACVTAILLFLAAVGIHYFESEAQPQGFGSVFHCLWWAVVTLTTVGYGDSYPITAGGKIFTFAILLVGLGVIAVPTGLVASALAKARELDDERARDELGSEISSVVLSTSSTD